MKVDRGAGGCLTSMLALRDGLCEEATLEQSLRGAEHTAAGSVYQTEEEARALGSRGRGVTRAASWTQEGCSCSRGHSGFPSGEMELQKVASRGDTAGDSCCVGSLGL